MLYSQVPDHGLHPGIQGECHDAVQYGMEFFL